MSLAACLPDRPLRFAETCTRADFDGIEVVSPLYASIDRSIVSGEEVVVASILLSADHGELAGFDPAKSKWNSVAQYPDITDLSGIHASLDVLETWLFERYATGLLVSVNVDFGIEV